MGVATRGIMVISSCIAAEFVIILRTPCAFKLSRFVSDVFEEFPISKQLTLQICCRCRSKGRRLGAQATVSIFSNSQQH
jgi:hypothetical protein